MVFLLNRSEEVEEITKQLETPAENHVLLLSSKEGCFQYVHAESGEIFTSFIKNGVEAFQKYKSVEVKSDEERAIALLDDISVVLLRRFISKQTKLQCAACKIDDPSQKHHTCLTLQWPESVQLYFDTAFKSLSSNITIGVYTSIVLSLDINNNNVRIPQPYIQNMVKLHERVLNDTEIPAATQNAVSLYVDLISTY